MKRGGVVVAGAQQLLEAPARDALVLGLGDVGLDDGHAGLLSCVAHARETRLGPELTARENKESTLGQRHLALARQRL